MIGHFADCLQWCFICERIIIFKRICNMNKSRSLPWTDSFFFLFTEVCKDHLRADCEGAFHWLGERMVNVLLI